MTANCREANRELNLREFRTGQSRLESRPRYLIIELTQGCNLSCPMCRPERIAPRHRSMSPELFSTIIEELAHTAELVDLRGWGESLILPNIAQHIEKVIDAGAKVRFVTNLSFRRDDIIELLARHRCHVAVSVDCADPHLFAQLRGGARLDRVTDNLKRMVSAYKRHHGTAEEVYVITTVQRPALGDLPALVDLIADLGVREMRLSSVTVNPSDRLSLEGDTPRVDEALMRCSELAEKRGIRLFAGTLLGSMTPKQDSAACLHPWAYAYFAFDGKVGFCDHLIGPEGRDYLLGDLAQQSFEEIWNGNLWRELRKEHTGERRQHAPFFDECHWCYKNRFIDFEHLFLPEAIPCRRRI